MKIFKFGGASIADAGRMTALLPIVAGEQGPLVIVMSALGKTTNALERVLKASVAGDKPEAMKLAAELVMQHINYAASLLNADFYEQAHDGMKPLVAELTQAVEAIDAKAYDRSYDRVVSMGELLSTTMFYYLLLQHGYDVEWVDARKVVRTDNTWRDAVVDWDYTKLEAEAIIGRKLNKGKIIITQGFIGSTEAGEPVTLGREGSDYTAAILGAMLNAASVTIWKDVDGFRNADPKQFPDTVKIDAISYAEVIEMAFYGAQIIHPKTIKPLHNFDIPLYVKCFLNKDLSGSVIKGKVKEAHYPPLLVRKDDQVLIQVTTRDFSFITEDNLSKIYATFHDLKVKINLIQNAAISFVACIDNRADKVSSLIKELKKDYRVSRNENVSILTVRHYTPEIFFGLTKGREVLMKQETRKTLQAVIK